MRTFGNTFVVLAASLLTLWSCHKDCMDCSIISDSCSYDNLVVCDSSRDLSKYVLRMDHSYSVGFGTAIKGIQNKGEIAWIANNVFRKFGVSDYGLIMTNYLDTAWVGLADWAYMREHIGIHFNPFNKNIQKVVTPTEFHVDTTLAYSYYLKLKDDSPDARWDIDSEKDNFVLVSNFDTINNIIEGEFDLNFILIQQSMIPGYEYAADARFKCGKFRAPFIR